MSKKFKDIREFGDLSDQNINGNIECDEMFLTSLEGCPSDIVGNFDCDNNRLTTLKSEPLNARTDS